MKFYDRQYQFIVRKLSTVVASDSWVGAWNGLKRIFWDDGHIVCLNRLLGYLDAYIYKYSLNCTL